MASPTWPTNFTPEQAQGLLDQGHITPDTFGRIVGNGATSAGISLPPPQSTTPPPPPANDPFAAGANAAGITPPPQAAPPPSLAPTPSLQSVQPALKPPGPKVEGGITLVGTALQRQQADQMNNGVASKNAPPPPQSASKRAAADNKKDQQKIDRADVDYIETGSNAPRMQRGHAPSKQEQQENELGRSLTDKEKSDPELLKRVLNAHQEGAQVQDAQDRQREAIQKGADIGSAKAAEEHALTTDKIALQEKQAADFEKGEKDRQAAIASRQQALNDEANRISKTKIQAKDLYGNMSTGNKILSGIFTFFGAAQATRGGQASMGNAYTNRIDQDIRDDLELQKANLQNRKDMLGAKRGLLGDFINMTKDAREGELMAHAKYLEIAKDKLLATSTKYKGDEVQNQAQMAAAQLDEKIADANQQRNDIIKQRLSQERAAAAAAAAARAKEERDRRWELTHEAAKDDALDNRQNRKEAFDAVKEAQKDGIAAPSWATKALGISANDTPSATTGASGGMTKEQRGKMNMEALERKRVADSQDEQIDRMLKSPVVTESSMGAAVPGATSGLGQRLNPDAAKYATDLDAANASMNSMGGKAIKDNEGRIPPAMLEQLHNFNFKQGETPKQKAEKVNNFRQWLHDRQTETGARPLPEPSSGKGAANDNADPFAQYKVK